MIKFILLQTSIGDYRQRFITKLENEYQYSDQLEIITGKEYFTPTVKTNITFKEVTWINNHYLLKRKFLWQWGGVSMFLKLTGAQKDTKNILICEGNPRILSTWLILILRKILKKPTGLWMHAWPRSGKESRSDKIRHLQRLLADCIVVYTETQKEELKEKMPKKKIFCAPNSLWNQDEMGCPELEADKITPTNILYMGRLVEEKKPIQLLEAFHLAINDLPKETKLVFVGEGPEKETLEKKIEEYSLKERVYLLGHINNKEKIKDLHFKSIATVSPGYVGLAITQSLSHGVPIIISRNEPHAPEIEAAKEGLNCLFFETNNINDLSQKIIDLTKGTYRFKWSQKMIFEDCKENYSTEKMIKGFTEATQYLKTLI
jgi:glycosyltransferase involved in cell wall biosynthesis